jgi:hypothetical protein
MRIPAIVIVALALGLAAGCGGPGRPTAPASPAAPRSREAAPPPGDSIEPLTPSSVAPGTGTGITGVTVLIGGCPVERVDQPCRERAVSVALAIVNPATNALVATVTSGADGVFRAATPPGRYLVRSATPTGPLMSHAPPVAVEVVAGHYTSVTLRFESGIR